MKVECAPGDRGPGRGRGPSNPLSELLVPPAKKFKL